MVTVIRIVFAITTPSLVLTHFSECRAFNPEASDGAASPYIHGTPIMVALFQTT